MGWSIDVAAAMVDMDGTLIDSQKAVSTIWLDWAHQRGFDPLEVMDFSAGRPTAETVQHFVRDAGEAASETARLYRQELDMADGVVAVPGAREFLNSVPSDRVALVTSATLPLARFRFAVAGLPFPRIAVTSEQVKRGKPHPEGYLRAAHLLSVMASDCLVLEDAPAGIIAARAVGAKVIQITGNHLPHHPAAANFLADLTGLAVLAKRSRLLITGQT